MAASSPSKRSASNQVEKAVEKIIRHIRACGLKPGDRYFTAEQASRFLGESLMTTHRAMHLLAKKNILERRPRAGTFIGEDAFQKGDTICVLFLLPEQSLSEEGTVEGYIDQIRGMKSILPGLSIQFHFVPNQDISYAQQIVQQASSGSSISGVILTLSSRPMRAYFNQSGIPTVVEGGVEPELSNLCWVQWNQTQVGHLLTSHLLKKGHKNLATIMWDMWAIGEHLLHDGINETLAAAKLPSTALKIRSATPERAAVTELTRSLLTGPAPIPTGFICRSEFQADCVNEVVKSLGKSKEIDIVHCNPPVHPDKNKYAFASPEISTYEMGRIMGEMFRDMLRKEEPALPGRLIDVKLKLPVQK